MYWVRRFTYLVFIFLCLVLIVGITPRLLDPTAKGPEKRARDRLWVSSSPYWLDRQACRWLGVCGLHHLRKDPAIRNGGHWDGDDDVEDPDDHGGELKRRNLEERQSWEVDINKVNAFKRGKRRDLRKEQKDLQDVPDYVLKYAPLVHLYSGEQFWPSDIKEHVEHMTVYADNVIVNATKGKKWTLDNLHELNNYNGTVVLRSDDDVESRPHWLHSHSNIPNNFTRHPETETPPRLVGRRGRFTRPESSTWYNVDKDHPMTRISDPRKHTFPYPGMPPPPKQRLISRGHKPDPDGYSKAPAILILVDKGSGIIDAFWFFFYSYNLGQTVLGIRFGNHVGDWEHCMIRFENGHPRGLFFSEHEGGQAYGWDAVEKYGDRPVIYSAIGSHAMYALPGEHPYVLPFRMLRDVTDKGPIWDPSLNNYAYHYDYTLQPPRQDAKPNGMKEQHHTVFDKEDSKSQLPNSLTPASSNPDAPVGWFHYLGKWGDEVYSLADIRQWRLFGQYHYVTGPEGPLFKYLERRQMCGNKKCRVAYELDPKGTWY